MTPITGKTFKVKDQLRKLGGKWDAGRNCWMVPDDRADEAWALVGGKPAGPLAERTWDEWHGGRKYACKATLLAGATPCLVVEDQHGRAVREVRTAEALEAVKALLASEPFDLEAWKEATIYGPMPGLELLS